MKQKVLMIYTGGTIGMKVHPETGALSPVDFDHLSQAIPELKLLHCQVHTLSFADPIDSSNIQPENWVELAQIVRNNYDLYEGFVILHGSDTMAYTASALSFLLENLKKPVILTGSQLPVGILRTDARENLISSIELAALNDEHGESVINEVCIYFEYRLYRGNRTFKRSSENFEAFQSPNYPELAEMGVGIRVNYPYLFPKSENPFTIHRNIATGVAVVPLVPGFNENLISKTVEAGTRGLILRTYGAGNAPDDVRLNAALREVINAGVPIVNVSQCRFGSVNQSIYASGKHLEELGIISGLDITLEAAVTKLMFLLGQGMSIAEISLQFGKSLRGEITN